MLLGLAEGGPLPSLVASSADGESGCGARVLVRARLADSQRQPYRSQTVAPDRGKPGSGVIETVRGRLSVNQRSWRDVSGTRLDEPLAPCDLRVAGVVWA